LIANNLGKADPFPASEVKEKDEKKRNRDDNDDRDEDEIDKSGNVRVRDLVGGVPGLMAELGRYSRNGSGSGLASRNDADCEEPKLRAGDFGCRNDPWSYD
jgi:hypothetical protein